MNEITPQTKSSIVHQDVECRGVVVGEKGFYFAIVPTLPEVNLYGKYLGNTCDDLRDALSDRVAEYLEAGEPIPWRKDTVIPKGRWDGVKAGFSMEEIEISFSMSTLCHSRKDPIIREFNSDGTRSGRMG